MKQTLVLIDFQHDYLAAAGLWPAAPVVVDAAARLLAFARGSGVPVIHVWTTVQRNPDLRMKHWKQRDVWKCEVGTAGHAPPADLVPAPKESIVHKAHFSGFGGTCLEQALRELGTSRIVVAGLHLHACVRATVLDALQRGLEVRVVEEAVASDDPVDAAAARRYLERRGVDFVPLDAAFADGGALPPAEVRGLEEAAMSWPGWSARRVEDRSDILLKLAGLLQENAGELARLMVREIGKPITMARGEVIRSIALIGAAVGQARATNDEIAADGTLVRRRPIGVVAAITPWNNPVAIPVGKIAPALAFGNVVAWKPAPAALGVSQFLRHLLERSGLPPDALVLVTGGRREAVALMEHPLVNAVTLSGSSAAGYAALDVCGRRQIPLQAELGGNNAAIVWSDADLDDAAAKVADGAFAFAGQRCTANRRVVVDHVCFDRFLDKLVRSTAALPWGDPWSPDTRVGPLVSEEAARRAMGVVDRARPFCERILTPHARAPDDLGPAYSPPTIVCCGDASQEIVQEESFAPILVVQPARDWDHAMALCNGVRQGLVAAVFSRATDRQAAFLERAQAGILKINSATADAGAEAPFGGWKSSGFGPPEHGGANRDFHTRLQSVYR